MQSLRKSVGAIVLLWSVLMFLLFFHAVFGRQKITDFLSYGYMLVTSFLLTKFVEKRDITERFGLQRNNVLGLLVVIYLGLTVAHYFDISDLPLIFFAPLNEEIFFRGYMLGTLSKSNYDKWKRILLTSVLFALAHIFTYHSTYPLDKVAWTIFAPFIGGMFFGFLYMQSKTILWCFLAHMLYNLFSSYRISMLILYLFILLGVLLKDIVESRQETDISSKL